MVDFHGNNVTADIKAILASIKKQNQDSHNKLCQEESQETSHFIFNSIGGNIDKYLNVEEKYNNNNSNHKQTIHKHKDSIRNSTKKQQPSIKRYFNVVKQSTDYVTTPRIHDILKSIKSNKNQSHTKTSEEDNDVIDGIAVKCLTKDNVSKNEGRNIQLSNNGNKSSLESPKSRAEKKISDLKCSQRNSNYHNSAGEKKHNILRMIDKIKNAKESEHVDSVILTKRESITFDDFCKNIIKNIDNNKSQTLRNTQKEDDAVDINIPKGVAHKENYFPKFFSTGHMEMRPKKTNSELNSVPITNCEIEGRKERLESSKLKFDDFMQNLLTEIKCNSQDTGNTKSSSQKAKENVQQPSLKGKESSFPFHLKGKETSKESLTNSNIEDCFKSILDSYRNEKKVEVTKVNHSSQNNISHMKRNKRKRVELSNVKKKITRTESILGPIKRTKKIDKKVVTQTLQSSYDKRGIKDIRTDINVDTANPVNGNFTMINELEHTSMDKSVVWKTNIKPVVDKPCETPIEEMESEDFLSYFSQLISEDFIRTNGPLSYNSKQIIMQPDELSKTDILAEDELLKPLHCVLEQSRSETSKLGNTQDFIKKKSHLETSMNTEQFLENSDNVVDCVISTEEEVYKADEIKHGQLENFFENLIKEQRQNASKVNKFTKSVQKKKCHIRKYRKGNMKIYKIKRLKKPKPKTTVQSKVEEPLNFDDIFKKITQDVIEVEYSLPRSKSMSSISTSSSYITDITKSETLSTGSHDLPSPQQRLRKGINELIKDQSLLCPQRDWEEGNNDDKDELKMKIQDVLLAAGEDFLEKRPSSLKYRRHSFNNCIFKDGRLQLKPINESSMTVINSSHARSQTRFKLLLYIMKKIQTLLETNTKLTKRELYYQLKTLVNDQRVIDRIINSISSLLDVGAWALNIIAQKGLVFGNMKILLSSGEFLNCNIRGTLIPQDVRDIVEIHSRAYFILVVEKESIFYKLIDEGLPERLTRPFIMITGKGFPDLNTQLFLNKLWMVMSIPVFILVDGDPHGINIMLNYRFGSVNNAHVSHHLAVPNAKWLGIYPSEIINLNLTREPLSERELKLVNYIMKTPYVENNPRIVRELKVLQEKKYKAEIEGLIKTDTFLTDVYLSNKFFTHNFI